MKRDEILQQLIHKCKGDSYLEIGVAEGLNFEAIQCKHKTSVDPALRKYSEAKPTHKMTSDEFFKSNTLKFDVIFIDGLHEAHQVEKDINNSLECLKGSGYILCHDLNPKSKEAQEIPRNNQSIWNGDCWKAWVKIRSINQNLNMYVIDTDHGCGVIQKGHQELLDLKGLPLTYENLKKNRKEWLNLISVKEFNE